MNKTARVIIGLLVGGIAGYAYHRLVGCSTGACPIVANAKISTLYGALMGLMVALN